MNSHEEKIIRCFEECLVKEVDPVKIGIDLVKRKVLPESYKYLILRENHGDTVWKFLLDNIIQNYCFFRFLELLIENGNKQVALRMSQQYHTSMRLADAGRHGQSAEKGQKLYMKYKIKAHNNLPNPRTYCNRKSQKYLSRFEDTEETDPSIKMEMADICIACLCAEISSYIMKYSKEMRVDLLFEEVENLICQSTNTHVAKISYHSHRALVCTIREEFEQAERHIEIAMKASIYVAQSVELINLYYVRLFLFFALYGRDPNVRNQKNVLTAAEDTLNVLEGKQDEHIRLFWKRMVLLRIAFCLLGLSYKGGPISGLIVCKEDIKKAKSYLAEAYKIREGSEVRRKISYEIAQARVAELENDPHLSILLLQNAVHKDEMGNYGETEIAIQYSGRLGGEQIPPATHAHQIKTNTSQETFPKTTPERLRTRQRILYLEDVENHQAVKEFHEGHIMPVINLHGHKTNPKIT